MRRICLWLAVVALLLPASAGGQGQAKKGKKAPDPVLAPVQSDPNLPDVLLIGDSISMGYTLPTRKLLEGKANVHRIPTNGGPTTRGLEQIDKWLGDRKWDVIHFNWGLHDLKMDAEGKHQVPLEEYQANLETLVGKMKTRGKVLIWASTTPVPEGELNPPRKNSDVVAYNQAAARIMKANGIAVDDLYSFALPRLAELQRPANVHFTPQGSEALARQVAASVEKALPK